MDDNEILGLFLSLYSDIRPETEFPARRPFLAHYTSIDVLEKILRDDEVWFSNPLFMNDLEEVRFGIMNGIDAVRESIALQNALGTERHGKLIQALDHYTNRFEQQYLLDTYIFCLTEQDLNQTDGLLSMWRGYGGNGKGAAIVFDTTKLNVVDNSPIILSRVVYGSTDERLRWLREMADKFGTILATNHIPDEKLHLAAYAVLDRIKLFALFSKHEGFSEENEWRIVYMPERDPDKKLKPMLHYLNGPRGVEPKLRFQVKHMPGLTAPDLSLSKVVARIILGPSTSTVLAVRSVARMLECIGKEEMIGRLIASTIPYRS